MVVLRQAKDRSAPHVPTDNNADDAALVAAAKRERSAFAPLYQRYADPVYRYCLRRLGSREAAEDATAQVFMKALAALPAYREESPSFRSWLFAVAHNVLVDTERAHRPSFLLEEAAAVADSAPGPEAAALSAEARAEVRSLLAAVAPDQRRVLELRLAGLTTVEIAAVLGCSPRAVRAAQFRAATRLRALMGFAPHGKGTGDA